MNCNKPFGYFFLSIMPCHTFEISLVKVMQSVETGTGQIVSNTGEGFEDASEVLEVFEFLCLHFTLYCTSQNPPQARVKTFFFLQIRFSIALF